MPLAKRRLLSILCCLSLLPIASVAQSQTPAGQKAAGQPDHPPEDAPAPPGALPGDSPMPSIDFQLHAAGGPPAGTKPQQLAPIPAPRLPLDLAMEAANTAIQACLEVGYRVGVAVTDENGQIRVGLAADGAAP